MSPFLYPRAPWLNVFKTNVASRGDVSGIYSLAAEANNVLQPHHLPLLRQGAELGHFEAFVEVWVWLMSRFAQFLPNHCCVRFLKDPYTPERLRRMGLNEWQIQAVLHLKVYGKVTNSAYQSLTGTTKRTASRDLEALVRMGLLEQIGETGKGTHYILKGTQRGQTRHKGDIKETKTP